VAIPFIVRDANVAAAAIEELRRAVGWNPLVGHYGEALRGTYAHFSIVDDDQLIGFARVIADGRIYALVVDVLVHPKVQHQGLGRQLVEHVVSALAAGGIQAIQLICEPALEPFYRACGFGTAALALSQFP
jgi:GNAT superfamily N-acetyltransferase